MSNIEMSAMEYFKTKNRMTNKCNMLCRECPLACYNNGTKSECDELEKESAEKAIEIVYNWGKEHPVKTMLQDFFEKFPNAPKDNIGTPQCCPKNCGYTEEDYCDDLYCGDFFGYCLMCWSRLIE